ncbi:MAG: hypothetical protein WAW02_07585 [Sideroxyarcus sp.]
MNYFIETFLQPGLINGLCYGIAAVGISLPLRFLGTADFTAVGAIMVGGMATIWITNASELWFIGLCCGAIIAGALGLLTAYLSLNRFLSIPLMFAGIICFTASQSLGLFIAEPGQIELNDSISFLKAKFTWNDVVYVGAIAVSVIVAGGLMARSKMGCLAFAMCANNNFVKFRHRYSQATTYWILLVSNTLVGLCGGLIVLKTRTAYSAVNVEFLSLTLGSIFAGQAVVQITARYLKRELTMDDVTQSQTVESITHKGRWDSFRLSFSAQRDESSRMWFIFMTYILASVALNNVAVAVRTHSLFNVSPVWEHVIVAMLITLGFFASNPSRKGR